MNFSLALWNDRCDSLHGVDEEDAKRILKAKTMVRVKQLVDSKEDIDEAYSHLFKEDIVSLGKRSTQYLIKWIASVRMAECVMARGRGHKDGKPALRGRRGRGKKFLEQQVVTRGGWRSGSRAKRGEAIFGGPSTMDEGTQYPSGRSTQWR